jgi:hypothetical protein
VISLDDTACKVPSTLQNAVSGKRRLTPITTTGMANFQFLMGYAP